MFRSVPRKDSGDFGPPSTSSSLAPVTEDDDTISLTSTVESEHPADEEFTVEAIHLNAIAEDGEDTFLVEWTGYPLHRCTWEPRSNLIDQEGLLERLLTDRAEREQKGQGWTFEKWQEIEITAEKEHLARHFRRNARRKKQGLPLTEPLEDHGLMSHSSDSSSSDDSDDDRPLAAIRRRSQAQAKKSSTENQGTPSNHEARRRSSQGDVRPARKGLARKVSRKSAHTSGTERPSTTGYQGTARKPSLSGPSATSESLLDNRPDNRPDTRSDNRPNNQSETRKILSPARKPAGLGAGASIAKTSATVTGATNVFAGGKIRKSRAGLKDALSDPTKAPKLFDRHRYRRLAEKISRDKEDRPPPLTPNMLLNLDPPSRRKSIGSEPSSAVSEKQPQLPSPGTMDEPMGQPMDHPMDEPTPAASEAHNHILSPVKTDVDVIKPLKKKKSVRFEETDPMFVDEPTFMEIDSPAEPAPSSAEGTIGELTGPGAEELHISERLVETTFCFGFLHGADPTTAAATMDGVPISSKDPWLAEFVAAELIQLEHTCAAPDFQDQKTYLCDKIFCTGTVSPSSESDGTIFETVAEVLREGILALYHTTATYSMLLYPSNINEWRKVLADRGTELGTPLSLPNELGSGLSYCIFRPAWDVRPFMRRLPADNPEKHFPSFEERLLWRLFKFDFHALQRPSHSKSGPGETVHHCFLLFPRDRSGWVELLARWVRASSPTSEVYTSYEAGSWLSFCEATDAAASTGVVMVHESLLLSLRRVPKLWHRLLKSRDAFWCFSEASQPHPLFPSLSALENVAPPGEINLVPLFPQKPKRRIAVFVTPSFLCSEPKRASDLLQWFNETWVAHRSEPSTTCRLVTAYNVHEYLGELARQKARERDTIIKEYKHNMVQAEVVANPRGLSQDDCAHRFKAALAALELHYVRAEHAGPDDVYEYSSPLQYADRCIDPNDEQSLVNWFGWWSSMRMDQFRGFHVVGSNSSISFRGSEKASLDIRIPKYCAGTVSDPDTALQKVDRSNLPKQAAQAPDARDDSSHVVPAAPSRPVMPWVFRSKRVPDDGYLSLFNILDQVWKRHSWVQREGLLRFYMYPVSSLNHEMSQYFRRDDEPPSKTIHEFWKYPWPFKGRFTMYCGFFHTMAEDWDPGRPPPDRNPRLYPWLCFYRLAKPYSHRNQRDRACEVIIWDPAAKDRFPGVASPREEELTFIQRRTIDLVRNNTAQKNEDSWLETVWLGGFDHPNAESPYHIDITLQYFEDVVENLMTQLPEGDAPMKRMGFRKVKLRGQKPDGPGNTSPAGSGPMDIDSPEPGELEAEEYDEHARIVFHPPRGRASGRGERTKCVNHLHKQATEVRNVGRDATHMRYVYAETREWYEVQRSEGRGFEHIRVAPWDEVFKLLNVQWPIRPSSAGTRGSTAGSDSTPRSPASTDRNMSMTRSYSG